MSDPVAPAFDIGTPNTGPELSHALGALLAAGTTFLQGLGDAAFFAPQGSAWSPAEHVRHLRKSATPVVTALGLPRWLLALLFRRPAARSRSFHAVRELYQAKLAAGATAGSFAPSAESAPADPAARRQEILREWASATVGLQNAIAKWPEEALDLHRLPHPLLGSLTVREMLHFTVYHTAHHLRRVAERSAA